MRTAAVILALTLLAIPARAVAQDPPKPIGPFVVDIRATIPNFPQDQQLADSRGLGVTDLPGSGLGLDLGAHVYLFTWKAVTFGAGGQITLARSSSSSQTVDGILVAQAVNEHYTAISPQISFNFGTGAGWSYLSAGVGTSVWSAVVDGAPLLPADNERLISYNYGGGARWFIKPHVAFTFDARLYDIYGGPPGVGFPASPPREKLVVGAGGFL